MSFLANSEEVKEIKKPAGGGGFRIRLMSYEKRIVRQCQQLVSTSHAQPLAPYCF